MVITGLTHRLVIEARTGGKDCIELIRQILDLGSSVLQFGSSRGTVESISSEVQRIVDRLRYESENQYSQILAEHKNALSEFLAQFLDPGRSSSVQMQIQALIRDSGLNHQQALQKVLSDQHGPLQNLRASFDNKINGIENKQIEILKDLSAISERLKMEETLEAAYQKGTAKGLDHEASILEIVDQFVSPLRDQVLDVSKELGLEGTKKGDSLVKLCEDDTDSIHAGYVIEAKDQKLSLPAALKELDLAMANRGVKVGVLVFARRDQMPTTGASLRLFSGNRILVALGDDGKNLELEVACHLARAIALHHARATTSSIDVVKVRNKAEKLGKILEEARAIEKGTSQARKGIDVIEAAYKQLRTEALEVVAGLKA